MTFSRVHQIAEQGPRDLNERSVPYSADASPADGAANAPAACSANQQETT